MAPRSGVVVSVETAIPFLIFAGVMSVSPSLGKLGLPKDGEVIDWVVGRGVDELGFGPGAPQPRALTRLCLCPTAILV